MSTNAHDIDPHALPDGNGGDGAQRAGDGATVAASASASAAAAPASDVKPLVQGQRTRFLSRHYTLPFPPLSNTLSFDDVASWPDDPMRVFSQWYADGEQAYNALSPHRMDGPVHWPNTMQIATLSPSGFPSVRTVLLKGFDPRGLVFFTNYDGAKGRALRANPRVAVNFYWKTLERQVRFEGFAEQLPSAEFDAYFYERPIQSQIGGVVSPQSRPIASHADLERAYVATVQGVAQHVQAQLGRTSSLNKQDEAAELEATKQRVSELLGALSLKANAEHPATPPATAAAALAGGSQATPVAIPAAAAPFSNAEAEDTHRAHAAALSSLQRLELSPLTQPLLHSLVKRPPYWGGFLIRPVSAEFWCDGAFRLHSRIVYRQKQEAGASATDVTPPKGTAAETAWTKTFLAP